jgi:hypothetical protein
MKKLIIFLLACLPMLGMAQIAPDTITNVKDTILVQKITMEHTGNWYIVVDSLTGTLDGTVEFVVANDPENSEATTQPHDSLFVRYSANMVDSLTANGAYSFYWDEPISFDYIGLKFTDNNITKWHINWKLKLFQKSSR